MLQIHNHRPNQHQHQCQHQQQPPGGGGEVHCLFWSIITIHTQRPASRPTTAEGPGACRVSSALGDQVSPLIIGHCPLTPLPLVRDEGWSPREGRREGGLAHVAAAAVEVAQAGHVQLEDARKFLEPWSANSAVRYSSAVWAAEEREEGEGRRGSVLCMPGHQSGWRRRRSSWTFFSFFFFRLFFLPRCQSR